MKDKDEDKDKDKDDLNVFSRFGNNIAFVQDELKDLPELKNFQKVIQKILHLKLVMPFH